MGAESPEPGRRGLAADEPDPKGHAQLIISNITLTTAHFNTIILSKTTWAIPVSY